MRTPSTLQRLGVVAGLALAGLFGNSARGDAVKVTILAAKSEAGEGASLPIDPTIRVRSPAQVIERLQSRDADRNVGDPPTPWATKRVGHDDRRVDTKPLGQGKPETTGRRIRIVGQQGDD